MAPNSAVGFVCLGVALYAMTSLHNNLKVFISLFVVMIVLSLGLVSAISYLTSLTTHYGLGQWIRPAIHTSITFIILGLGLISFIYLSRAPGTYIPLLPLIVSFMILLFAFLAWQGIKKNQDNYLNQLIEIKLENVRNLINQHMQERSAAFSRITYRWINREVTPQQEWLADVLHYIKDQPGYIAIEWIDSSYHIRWVAPEEGNAIVKGFDLSKDSNHWLEMKRALHKNAIEMSPEMHLIQGGRGVLLFSPIIKDEKFGGFMVGVINIQKMLSELISPDMTNGFGVEVFDQDNLLYGFANQQKDFYPEWQKSANLSLLGQTWQIKVWPTPELYYQITSPWITTTAFIIGSFIACLSGFLISLLQLLNIRSAKLNEARHHLAQANGRLFGIIEGSRELIAAMDLDMNFIAFNSMYKSEVYRLFKIDLLPGMNFSVMLDRMDEINRSKALKLWQKAMEGVSFSVIESFADKRFKSLNYEVHYNPLRDGNGVLIGASHIATDITQRIINENEMAESKLELERLVLSLEQQNKELVFLKEMINILQSCVSIEATIKPIETYINKILSSSSGVIYLIGENDNTDLNKMVAWGKPLSHPEVIEKTACWALLRSQNHEVNMNNEVWCDHVANSNEKPDAYVCIPLHVQGENLGLLYLEINPAHHNHARIIDLAQILSEQIALSFYNIKLRDELKAQSTHDSLTGLYNRRFLEEYIQKEFFKAQRSPMSFALLLVDIDYFKLINDNHGHLIGDKVLQAVAQQLNNNCRKSDLLCRWGGEEFLLFLRESSKDHVRYRAESIRKSIERLELEMPGIKLAPLTISIGVSFYPEDGDDLDSLTGKADEALYQAKNQGRNRVVVSGE